MEEMTLSGFRKKYFGIFWSLIFVVATLLAAFTVLPGLYLLSIQESFTNLFTHSHAFVGHEQSAYRVHRAAYFIFLGCLIVLLVIPRIPVSKLRLAFIIFCFAHFFFASGYMCHLQLYERYKESARVDGFDVFTIHVAMVEISVAFPFIGIFFDGAMSLKKPQS